MCQPAVLPKLKQFTGDPHLVCNNKLFGFHKIKGNPHKVPIDRNFGGRMVNARIS